MTVRGHQYERRGLLAIDPKAFWEVFFCDDGARENTEVDGCTIVDIRGPLEKDSHPWCDSYEDIIARVTKACATGTRAVIMRFDSPGGDAQGCFEAADKLREVAQAAGKQLHAYADGDLCSAAYGLACAAESITISATALIGSIGCISTRDDVTAMNASRGLRVALITSGARKADGHPDQPLSESELANTQGIVNSMAGVFFDLVARSRPTLTVESIAKLEAKVFHGQAAVNAGLADAVGPLSSVLARVAGVANGDTNMAASAFEKARALLQEAAEGDDANAKAAREALASLTTASADGDEEKKEDEPAGDPPKEGAETPDKDTDAAGDPPPQKDEAMAAAAYREAIKAQRDNAKLRAEIRKRDEVSERATLIASCPGLAPEMIAILQKAPMDLVRETIEEQRKEAGSVNASQQLTRAPTRGAGQGAGNGGAPVPAQSTEAKAALDLRMGLTAAKPTVVNTEYTQKLGVYQPATLSEAAGHKPASRQN